MRRRPAAPRALVVGALLAGASLAAGCVGALPGSNLAGSGGGPPASTGGAGGAPVMGTGGVGTGTGAVTGGGGIGGSAVTGAGGRAGAPPTGSAGTVGGPGTGGSVGPPSPYTFVPNAGRPRNLAVDSQFVYWASSVTRAVMKAPVAGGPASPVAVDPQHQYAAYPNTWVAADGESVYWSTGPTPTSSNIVKASATSGTVTVIASGLPSGRQFAVGRDAIFLAGDDITKISLTGGSLVQLAAGQFASEVVVDDASVYWFNDMTGAIMKVALSGGTPVMLAQAPTGPPVATGRIALDAKRVYWIDRGGAGSVLAVGINGGQSGPIAQTPFGKASVAADASGVYWTDTATGLVAAALTGAVSSMNVTSTPTMPAYGIALDATSIYWIGQSDGSILRTLKPVAGLACSSPMATDTITNFEDASGTDPIRFGMPPAISGQTFTQPQDANRPGVRIVQGTEGNALQVSYGTNAGAGFGAGLRFDTPVDATAYNAIRFTLGGGCPAAFGVMTVENTSSQLDPRGMCPTAVCPMSLTNVPAVGTYCLPIKESSPLLGLLWSSFGACSFTIDDVALIKE